MKTEPPKTILRIRVRRKSVVPVFQLGLIMLGLVGVIVFVGLAQLAICKRHNFSCFAAHGKTDER